MDWAKNWRRRYILRHAVLGRAWRPPLALPALRGLSEEEMEACDLRLILNERLVAAGGFRMKTRASNRCLRLSLILNSG
jgi:hypothetical protein